MLSQLIDGLLELLFPERCVVCACGRFAARWATGVGGSAPGLRGWHASHLCADCCEAWRQPVIAGRVGIRPLWSALPESAALVQAVGAWKYQGLRGLSRPFAALLVPSIRAAACDQPTSRLVPVPLHRRRRRERGFDQCHQLAVLAGRAVGLPLADDILMRRRATAQQASAPTDGNRRSRNVAEAFTARARRGDESADLVLLDDLATTGATLAAAADALTAAGWRVTALTALGQAQRLRQGRG